ncbi:MAG: hypothetical protein MK135_04180 [Polyangiaceae bacterium]|nr:hypothetical protein [Polyangiaceae bacterium]
MSLLFLGPAESNLLPFLREQKEAVIQVSDPISADLLEKHPIEFIVSYGFRHIIREPFLSEFAGRIINLHISLLPWNRGADPNFWSFVNQTPHGVSIHQVDQGVDTGPILLQEEVKLDEDGTLRPTYRTLQERSESLFQKNYKGLREQSIEPRPQVGLGSEHRAAEKLPYIDGFEDIWLDLPIAQLLREVRDRGE